MKSPTDAELDAMFPTSEIRIICPYCQTEQSKATRVVEAERNAAQDGDLCLCYNCAGLSVFVIADSSADENRSNVDGLTLRKITLQECRELPDVLALYIIDIQKSIAREMASRN